MLFRSLEASSETSREALQRYWAVRKPYLSISDGDDIGWNVSRHIPSLSLDDRQGSQRAAPKGVVHFGCSLQQAGVQVEHITRVGLTARGAAQQQRHLTVSNSLRGARTAFRAQHLTQQFGLLPEVFLQQQTPV